MGGGRAGEVEPGPGGWHRGDPRPPGVLVGGEDIMKTPSSLSAGVSRAS